MGGLIVGGSVINGAYRFSYTKTKQTNQQRKVTSCTVIFPFPFHYWDR